MTPENPAFIQLSKSVEESSATLSRLEAALLGDPIRGQNGIIHDHHRMNEDLYGIGADGRPIEGKGNTIMARMSNMEDNQKKATYVFAGVLAAVISIKFGITTLWEKIMK